MDMKNKSVRELDTKKPPMIKLVFSFPNDKTKKTWEHPGRRKTDLRIVK